MKTRLKRRLRQRLKGCRLLAFDFDGVFTDNIVYVNEKGEEMVRCNRSDTFGLKELQTHVKTLILSTEKNNIVRQRARKLGIPCQNNVREKQVALTAWAKRWHIPLARVVYVGNDENDLTCFAVAGVAIAVADAYPSVRQAADYVTMAAGGRGAVREVIALLLAAKKQHR